MKKIDKKGIVKLIFLIIFLIMQIKAFDNSRANKLTYITAKIVDFSGLLSEETSTLIAINEGDNGMAITLPNILNTKKVSKYFITKKKIIENESTEEPETIEETVTEESITVEEKTTVNYIENNVEETETSGSVETIEEIGSDFNDDEVSLIETLANEAREEVAAKASNESTALIEVKQPDSFLVSARSLGKFYRFKKRIKLACYKLFKTLPKLLSADFFEEKQ